MLRRLLPLLLVLVIAACSSDDDPAVGGGSSTTTTAAPAITATVDWTARTVSVSGSDIGVEFCEGDGPFLCLSSPDGEPLGGVEHLDFDPVDDLDAFADDFAESMREDRIAGCDPGFELTPAPTVPATLFGAAGVRYGYSGSIDDTEVERVIGHAANVDGRLHLVTANFLADDGCLAREGELPLDAVDDVAPLLDAIAAGSTF